MIVYADNPSLKLKVVTTVSGDKEYRRNCKFIKGKYYVMEKDCFFVNNQWYRKDSGKIEFDYENKVWLLKGNPNLKRGVVDFDEKGHPIMGSFTENIYKNCKVNTENGTTNCIDVNLLLQNGYFEDLGKNIYYSKKAVGAAGYTRMTKIRNEQNFQHKGYNIEENGVEFEQKKRSYAEYPLKLSKDVQAYGKLLGNLTFGCEIETSEGNMPDFLQYRYGLVACRDGSINSAEWVTVPMAGAKGLQTLNDAAQDIAKRCNIDINCSFHIHMGNIPTDRTYITALYILAYRMQDDMFKMFPYFKTDPRGIKKKNYCQKLKQMQIHPLKDQSKEGFEEYVKEVFERVFTFLSDGTPPGANWNKKRQQHPIQQKWNRHSRYYWLNLQNMIFSERETAEFRLHTATLNPQKMINWLFICNAIIRYAEKYTKEIITGEEKISVNKVLDYYADNFPRNEKAAFLSEYLKAYYKNRCMVFKKDMERGDKISAHDLESDKAFKFTYKGVTELF